MNWETKLQDDFYSSIEFLSEDSLDRLTYQQKELYAENWSELLTWLREKGKTPHKHVGYAESNIRPTARRIHQVFEYTWEHDRPVVALTPEHADRFIEALNQDEMTTNRGDAYDDNSKRKFSNGLGTYFRFIEQEWEPAITFSDEPTAVNSDPFTWRERGLLLTAACEFRSPPNYSNLSPEGRDRWKAHIAQYLGKPKERVDPSDWKALKRSWKTPSLINTALDAGWRAAMVGRLQTDHLNLRNQQIIIPGEVAVKNGQRWVVNLTEQSTKMLEQWLEQRATKPKYDDTNALWLNRESNPYNSANLNTLLNQLMEEAQIEPAGRKLTWHSIRHSTGMYVYDRKEDIGIVAEILRHKTLEAARRYAHLPPETKQEVVEGIGTSPTGITQSEFPPGSH